MPNIPDGLLACAILLTVSTGEGCTQGGVPASALAADPDKRTLVIDLASHTASTSDWTVSTSDCTDETYYCVAIPEKMVLAFPKSCRTVLDVKRPATQIGTFKPVAPFPHLSFPSGGFVIDQFPNMLMVYLPDQGIVEVRNTRHSPYEKQFNFEDYSARYLVRTADGEPLFVCR